MDAGMRLGELLEYEDRETKRWKEWFAAHPEALERQRLGKAKIEIGKSKLGRRAGLKPGFRKPGDVKSPLQGFAGAGLGEVARAGQWENGFRRGEEVSFRRAGNAHSTAENDCSACD